MAGVKYKRHWFTVRRRGEREIRCLLSAFSPDHIRRKANLNPREVVIDKAKRWQVVWVFSGNIFFYERKDDHNVHDINSLVPNEFHMVNDGIQTLVKVLS